MPRYDSPCEWRSQPHRDAAEESLAQEAAHCILLPSSKLNMLQATEIGSICRKWHDDQLNLAGIVRPLRPTTHHQHLRLLATHPCRSMSRYEQCHPHRTCPCWRC
ncbi:hypothetical protein H310_08059 [Aphanomyces invadans]|uniref:Uncharacterized protein n=1 Tax=Aphanomyces invadans TaxID=157072 RepID=A0A024U148_9STRA|nr:hypothetical protein H310_08059 [Aphanomyces invadans]ETV99332.1 hypothetical protein H310_08059 [Aphanomyces invadans]|eukprot:XP_008871888.1 hypothetical protein H310_08059 [Aphanomyces invadans]